jgi:acetyl-CoA C-acetyltransferase
MTATMTATTATTTNPVFVLGGAQSDFARNLAREGVGLAELTREVVEAALADAQVEAAEIDVVHVGNAFGELFTGQAHLGALPASVVPSLWGKPAARHEAACASGSIAALAAAAELEAGRYDCALVVGIEQERNVPGELAARHLGAAAWVGREGEGARFLWPHMFSRLADEIDRRHGLAYAHLAAIARKNFANARRNPRAQTRNWTFAPSAFTEDDSFNPVVEGRVRRQDCGQITDGGAAVVLASARFAAAWAARRGLSLDDIPRVAGWGHRTGGLSLDDKLARSAGQPYLVPHLRDAITDAYRRAGIAGPEALDGIETHDCFTVTEYLAIDHFGLTPPGEAWRAVEDGSLERGGRLPVNPSGGLIGLGHPVGATGVRMLLDAARQVAGRAGETQIDGARRFATLNIGGSATTAVSFIVAVGEER